jgi:hypothetical protein
MTDEEHVATAETHLRYAEGHLQPTEEHMADAEVHLMLVKAHLAALAAAESPEVELHEVESLPPIELAGGEADAAQRIAAPGKDRARPRDLERSGEADPVAEVPARERGSG